MGVEIGKKVSSSGPFWPLGRRSPEWTARVSKRLGWFMMPYNIKHAPAFGFRLSARSALLGLRFQHGYGCSRLATPARTMSWTLSLPRWPPSATSGSGSCRSRGRLLGGGAAPAFREARRLGRRAYSGTQPPARIPARPRSWRGAGGTLEPPSRAHPPRHTAAGGRLGPPPPAVGFGGPALRIRTLDRKIADLNGRIEAEVEASGTTLTEIFGIGPYSLAAKIIGTVGSVARFPTTRPTLPPTVARRRWRPPAGRW